MFWIVRWMLVLLLFAGPSVHAEEPSVEDAEAVRVSRAQRLVRQLSAGEFEQAVEHFDAVMTRVLPPEDLSTTWKDLGSQFGSFQKVAESRTEVAEPYHLVFVTMQFERGQLDAKVVFTEGNEVTGLFFVAGRYRPPSYAQPDSFVEEDVTVGAGLWAVPGTLALPRGSERVPAVVLVHGSGPQDRDETIGGNKPFRDLAHGLASQGIAVLRYDKRTHHHRLKAALLSATLTVQQETIEDAVAAVEAAASHPRVDSVFVLGHSLGGYLFPRIAGQTDQVAGFISLAGSTRPLEDLITSQTRYLANMDGEITAEEQSQLDQIAEQIARAKDENLSQLTLSSTLPLGIPASYWLDLRQYNAAEAAQEVEVPMLFLQGERDYQVTLKDFDGWKAALKERQDVTFKLYPQLNHLFMPGEGPSSPAEYMTPSNVDAAVIQDIAKWVREGRK